MDRQKLIAEALERAKWTHQELDYAESLILTDAKLLKEIDFNRTIGVGVFAQARERREVMRGRLFTHQESIEYASAENEPRDRVFEVVRIKGEQDKPWWILK